MGININSKILLSVASIAAAAALVIGATFAFFSDEETSSNNVFATGTLDLVLCDDDENVSECPTLDEGPEDSVTATWTGTDMVPGGSEVSGTLTLGNNGSIDGNHVDIQFSNSITQSGVLPGSATTNDLDQYLEVTTLTYDSADLLPSVTDTNGNSRIDLADLAAQSGNDLVNLDGILAGDSKDLVMGVTLHSSAPNDLQGDSVDTTLTVTLQQAPHGSE